MMPSPATTCLTVWFAVNDNVYGCTPRRTGSTLAFACHRRFAGSSLLRSVHWFVRGGFRSVQCLDCGLFRYTAIPRMRLDALTTCCAASTACVARLHAVARAYNRRLLLCWHGHATDRATGVSRTFSRLLYRSPAVCIDKRCCTLRVWTLALLLTRLTAGVAHRSALYAVLHLRVLVAGWFARRFNVAAGSRLSNSGLR